MTKEEQFKKELEEKIQKSLQDDKHNRGLIINDDNQDWGGCHNHYITKNDLT
jgi:hypothetical protein